MEETYSSVANLVPIHKIYLHNIHFENIIEEGWHHSSLYDGREGPAGSPDVHSPDRLAQQYMLPWHILDFYGLQILFEFCNRFYNFCMKSQAI